MSRSGKIDYPEWANATLNVRHEEIEPIEAESIHYDKQLNEGSVLIFSTLVPS
jgi:hypothetical protein